ncbi:MAG: NAD(P)/FAD-dependent oxidoreductase, partial [Dehalococcoidia bacterium]
MTSDDRVPSEADVVVIGGGPAGTTTAALLAARGRRVVLFERARFPRHHVGESMLPASLPILDALGVKDAIDGAGFVKKWGAAMVWGQDRDLWSWYFRETNGPYEHAYQVPRAEFDHLLMQNARRRGVDVREEHRITAVDFEGERATGVRWEADGASGSTRARMVVDASGQIAMLASRLQLREWDGFFRNLAVYGYFPGAAHLDPPDDGSILIESFDNGWVWKIPLHTGASSVGVVVDSEFGQARLRETSPEAFLAEQVALASKTTALLGGVAMEGAAYVVKDWSYVSSRMTGDGFVLVGDAACFIDPLFSSGVHLAMQAGLMGAAYVETVLKDPSLAAPAGAEYESEYRRRYGYFHELARLFYGSNAGLDTEFWRARRLDDVDWSDAPRQQFINLVSGHPPAGYERVVLERGASPGGFAQRLAAVEDASTARRE